MDEASTLAPLGRVRLCDLAAVEGLPSDGYKLCVSALTRSLAQYSAAVIQLPPADGALLRSGLDSARLFFHQRRHSSGEAVGSGDAGEWCKTSGYYADPQMWLEVYDHRPGIAVTELPNGTMNLPPSGLPDIFSVLGKVSRDVLDAIAFSLNLRSCAFVEILDNMPLRSQEVSSSVLSACCHSRPSFEGAQQHGHSSACEDDGEVLVISEQEQQIDKALLTLVKSDRPGLYVKDLHGRWILVDGDLGPHDVVVYPGLALYQETAGYVNPAVHKTEVGELKGCMFGRCSLAFKLMPRSVARLRGSEMRAAGHGVDAQFQVSIPVNDFMQTEHSTEQRFPESSPRAEHDVSYNSVVKRKKVSARTKPLPLSKKLRLEAQRVLKERVQDIADKKGIKLRFCNLKECESHIRSLDSPCENIRSEIGWPLGVPFVHPHDLPNKAKVRFLEAYEPGWTASQQDLESR